MATELAALYPLIGVDADVLYVDHGDIATSAGTGAAIDLCLALVRSDLGAAYAGDVARHMVLPPHREGGQVQYAQSSAPSAATSLAPLMEWATGRLDRHLTIIELATRVNVSSRSLARRFQSELGISPGRWLPSRAPGGVMSPFRTD